VVKSDGGNLNASKVAVGGTGWATTTNMLKVFRGAPVQVSALFELPGTTSSLRILSVNGSRADNVAVKGAAAPAVDSSSVNLAGNWNATLTDCKQTSPGVVVCTATLKK